MDNPNATTPNYLEFFDILAPIEVPLYYMGQERRLKYHILTGEEEAFLIVQRDQQDMNLRLLYEGYLRLAISLVAVNDLPCDSIPLEKKLDWIKSWPGPLLDAALLRYDAASQMPLMALSEILADENFEIAPGANGSSSTGADSSKDGNSPPENGRLRLSTLLKT